MVLPYPHPELNDGVVRLRPWRLDDWPAVEAAGADPRIPRMTTVPVPFTADEGRAFIERQWSRQGAGEGISLAIADAATDEPLGLISVMVRQQPGVVGHGYWIVPAARRQGHARRALELASTWALGAAGMARAEAYVEPDNPASMRVLESAGFQREGTLRSFLIFGEDRVDAVVFSRVDADEPA